METSFKLRSVGKFRQVVIAHDRTKLDWEQCNQLVTEARERESQEPVGEYSLFTGSADRQER